MSLLFIHRDPTLEETTLIQLAMSTFCDGSGQLRDIDGSTRPGWRDFERIFAEILNGFAPENKEIFDVVVPTEENTGYGFSIKSKELDRANAIETLDSDGRVYMELSNSPAKFWNALRSKGLSEEDFRNKKQAELIGNTLLEVVENWHKEAAEKYVLLNPGKELDLESSVFLVVSYSKGMVSLPRIYQVHSFSLHLPKIKVWRYVSDKCLRGYDPLYPNEAIIDWYAFSGGQLKYYPKASTAKYKTKPFQLVFPQRVSILERVKVYFPKQFAGLQKKK